MVMATSACVRRLTHTRTRIILPLSIPPSATNNSRSCVLPSWSWSCTAVRTLSSSLNWVTPILNTRARRATIDTISLYGHRRGHSWFTSPSAAETSKPLPPADIDRLCRAIMNGKSASESDLDKLCIAADNGHIAAARIAGRLLGSAVDGEHLDIDHTGMPYMISSAHYLRQVVQHSSVTHDDRAALAHVLLHMATASATNNTTTTTTASSPSMTAASSSRARPSSLADIPSEKRAQVKEATSLLTQAARGGHIDSALELSAMYSRGHGRLIRVDHKLALTFARLAVTLHTNNGSNISDIRTRYNYGMLLLRGHGLDYGPDVPAAMVELQAAADAGYQPAMRVLAEEFIKQGDTATAVKWWVQSAELGGFEDQCRTAASLAKSYSKGWTGTPADDTKAVQWWMRANLMANGGIHSANENTVCSRMSHESQYHLSVHRLHGSGGLPKDVGQAVAGILAAAHGGYAEAQNAYAMICANGDYGVTQSNADAVTWMRRAATANHCDSCAILASWYDLGSFGLQPSIDDAIYWLQRACTLGFADGPSLMTMLHDKKQKLLHDTNMAALTASRSAAVMAHESTSTHVDDRPIGEQLPSSSS